MPDEPAGDSADQANSLVEAAEQAAIAAALSGGIVGDDRDDDGRPNSISDEPALDFGDPDDSDDPVHGGGDPVGMTLTGAMSDSGEITVDELVDE